MAGMVLRRVDDPTLTEDDLKKAREELNEDPENVDECIKKIREMLAEEPNLHVDATDFHIKGFLRGRKYSCDRTFKLMKNYFKGRYQVPELFEGYRVGLLKPILEDNLFTILPYRDYQNRAIYVFRPGKADPGKIGLLESIRLLGVATAWYLKHEPSQIHGIIGIFDLSGLGLRHLKEYFQIRLLSKTMSLIQDAMPCRIKEIHVLNLPFFVNSAYTIFKTFLKEKIRKRIVFHSNLSSLHKSVPSELLPSELGGSQGPLDCMQLYPKLVEFEPEFLDGMKNGYRRKSSTRRRSSFKIGSFKGSFKRNSVKRESQST